MKMDPQSMTGDNPRRSRLAKRKMLESKEEFERECKKLRPDFDPEYECDERMTLQQKVSIEPNTIPFFPIFTKNRRELNPDAMFNPKPNPNSNSKNQKRKPKVRKTQSDNPGANQNIMTMFKQQQIKMGGSEGLGESQESKSNHRLGDWVLNEGSARVWTNSRPL